MWHDTDITQKEERTTRMMVTKVEKLKKSKDRQRDRVITIVFPSLYPYHFVHVIYSFGP